MQELYEPTAEPTPTEPPAAPAAAGEGPGVYYGVFLSHSRNGEIRLRTFYGNSPSLGQFAGTVRREGERQMDRSETVLRITAQRIDDDTIAREMKRKEPADAVPAESGKVA